MAASHFCWARLAQEGFCPSEGKEQWLYPCAAAHPVSALAMLWVQVCSWWESGSPPALLPWQVIPSLHRGHRGSERSNGLQPVSFPSSLLLQGWRVLKWGFMECEIKSEKNMSARYPSIHHSCFLGEKYWSQWNQYQRFCWFLQSWEKFQHGIISLGCLFSYFYLHFIK